MSELVLENNLDLPQGWIKTKLEYIVESIVDKDHTTPKYVKDNGIPLISPKDFTENSIDFSNPKLISKTEHIQICKKCEPLFGDLLFSRIGTIGKVRKVPENKIFNILHSIVLIRPNSKIAIQGYLFYLLQTHSIQLQAKRDTKSVGTPDLGIIRIRNFDVICPPLNEQKRIVEKIEVLLSLIDSSKQVLEKIKILLKHYRQSILKSAFNGKLVSQDPNDEPVQILEKTQLKNRQSTIDSSATNKISLEKNDIPQNWIRTTLPYMVQNEKYAIQRGPFGGSLKKEIFTNKGYLVYEQFHAINDDFSMARYFIDEKKYNEMNRFKVESGDMIISCSGVTLGRIAQIPENAKAGIINQALLKISLNPQIVNATYFTFLFRSDLIQKTIFRISRGTGMPNFPSLNEIKSILFLIPPLNEQKRIVEKIEADFSLIHNCENIIERLLLQNNSLKNAVFKQAFVGKLIPQDPNDEPAEILLQKIKQEKEQLKQKEKSKKRKKNGR